MTPISLVAEKIYALGQFPVTNALLSSVLALLLLCAIAAAVRLTARIVPRGFYNFVESAVEGLFNLVEQVTGSRQETKAIFPILATFFLFILVNNWIALLPGWGSILLKHGGETVPLLRGVNADLNTTLALALISVGITQYYGIKASGWRYSKKFLNFSSPIAFFVGILELISEFAKVISFSFRLFGNIFAGEVLLLVITFLVPYLAPVPFYALELFVGLIQALVFMMLTLVFIKLAKVSEGH